MNTTTAAATIKQTIRSERAAREITRKYDLCLDCTEAPTAKVHQPGYKMHRTAYDIPGHQHVSWKNQ